MSAIHMNTNFSNRGRIADTTINFGMASMAATLPGNVLESLALADIAASWPAPAGMFWVVADIMRSEDEDDARAVVSATLNDLP